MMSETHDEQTRVKSVKVVKIIPAISKLKCKNFKAVGPQEFDRYYCGCHGWN